MKTSVMLTINASSTPPRHSREGGNPVGKPCFQLIEYGGNRNWVDGIPAFAGMTSMLLASLMLYVASLCPVTANATQVETPYTTAARYNVAGQVTGTIAPDPDGGGSLRLLATRNTYDCSGLLIKVESGQLTSWPDETVDPGTACNPLGSQTWDNYGFSGANIFSTTLISYDSLGRKIQELGLGRNLSAESEVEYSYDSRDHVLCKAVRMSKTTFSSSYVDACTQRSGDSTQPDRIYRYTYDGYDQVVTEERGIGTPLAEVYVTNTHNARRLTSQKDANGNLTQLTYDETGYRRLQYRYYPSPTTAGAINTSDYNFYTYDANGNVQTERKRSGAIITYSYDADNHVTTKDLSDNTYSQDVVYDYDARGLMLHAAYGNDSGPGIYTTYDGFGRVYTSTNTMGGASRTLIYQYDNNGNRTRITHPDGNYFQYGFDGLNRLNVICENASSCVSPSTASLLTATYQTNGSLSYIARNGTVSVSSITLDNANRVLTLTHDLQGTADDLTNTFGYNAASQITQLTQSNTAYSYTGNDNKTGAYAPDGLNRYTSINGQAISYDLNQNLTGDGTNTYTYDMENHLVQVSGVSGGVTANLTYDPMGRLFQATISGTATTQFLWDNNALVAEYVNGTMSKRYVHGDQVDDPLVQYNGTSVGVGLRQYLYADHQGSIIALSDNNGNAITKYKYDNYGIPGNISDYRFGYTGQLWFKALKLNYYKARWYSPYLGRFMQTDPIFYKDDMDLYSYVGNDPMDRDDPTGLCAEDFCISEGVAVTNAALERAAGTTLLGIATGYVTYKAVSTINNGVRNAVMNASNNNSNNNSGTKPTPPLPEKPVGEGPKDTKTRTNSGPLAPEHGGTGDPAKDFEKLTGGNTVPTPEDRPEGTQVGENGIQIRPAAGDKGARIDILANGTKKPETLHYPPPPPPPQKLP